MFAQLPSCVVPPRCVERKEASDNSVGCKSRLNVRGQAAAVLEQMLFFFLDLLKFAVSC